MVKWIEPSHPQVLTGAVVLGYINAFSSLIGGGGWGFALAIVLGLGALGTANNKKIGLFALTVAATFRLVIYFILLIGAQGGVFNDRIIGTLTVLNSMIFSVGLLAAVFHKQTRDYRKIWFE